MPICSECNKAIPEKEARMARKAIVCEDCYIDEVMPKMPKAHYDNDAEFMNRLKDAHSVRRQRYY